MTDKVVIRPNMCFVVFSFLQLSLDVFSLVVFSRLYSLVVFIRL